MKKDAIQILKRAIFIGAVMLTGSCGLTPELVETPATRTADQPIDVLRGPIFSVPVTLDRVRIFTASSDALSGTVTVEIATTNGAILGSCVLDARSLLGTKWTTFHFAPVSLMPGTKYRIQVKRSDEPGTFNAIHWGASDGKIDAYPQGETSISGTHPPYDMAFITYSNGNVDQKQMLHPFFWGIGTNARWQEFVPERDLVILP